MAGNWQRHSMVRISIAKHRETGRLRVVGAKRVAALVDDTPRIVEATSTHQGTAWSVDNAVRGEVWIDRGDGNGAERVK